MSGQKIPVSVLVVIHDPKGQVLLLERVDRPGFWQSVTGSLDYQDEALSDAARREVAEETGWVVESVIASAIDHGRQAYTEPSPEGLHRVRAGLPAVQSMAEWQLCDWLLYCDYQIYEHWRHRYPEGVHHNREHVFSICVPEGSAPQLAPREHQAYSWLPGEQAAERCFSASNAAVIRALVCG